MKGKVAVGMSGGVDSSVTALLLKELGYEVIGITLKLSTPSVCSDDIQVCCSPQDIKDAKKVANYLGIKHYTLDWEDIFKKEVISYFEKSYESGLTPNPCAVCNKKVKTGRLAEYVKLFLEVDFFATGHYIRKDKIDGFPVLKRGVDTKKDQSYFMALINPDIVDMLIFPLGDMTKEQVRELALKYRLPVSQKKDSFEICFTAGKTPAKYLKENGFEFTQGDIIHISGVKLGRHKGFPFYTIGQRRGLGIRWKSPLYVIDKVKDTNTIVVGEEEYLYTDMVQARDINLFVPFDKLDKSSLFVQGRYNQKPIPVEDLIIQENSIKVMFKEKQKKFAPGQILALYQEEKLVAGGIIA